MHREETSEVRGEVLLDLARGALEERLLGRARPAGSEAEQPWLREPGATFVTLTLDGRLRGCVGTLTACRPLREDVVHAAVSAAFHDRRFPPLGAAELPRVRIEVSLLDPPEPLESDGEAQARQALRPGVDGLILEHGARRATFLPQVWRELPEPGRFLRQLKLKAGLPADFWDDDVRLWRYRVRKWSEPAPPASGEAP
jgi:AmmeMemoRadiSam system protein A